MKFLTPFQVLQTSNTCLRPGQSSRRKTRGRWFNAPSLYNFVIKAFAWKTRTPFIYAGCKNKFSLQYCCFVHPLQPFSLRQSDPNVPPSNTLSQNALTLRYFKKTTYHHRAKAPQITGLRSGLLIFSTACSFMILLSSLVFPKQKIWGSTSH